jgi:hypothetical protein
MKLDMMKLVEQREAAEISTRFTVGRQDDGHLRHLRPDRHSVQRWVRPASTGDGSLHHCSFSLRPAFTSWRPAERIGAHRRAPRGSLL